MPVPAAARILGHARGADHALTDTIACSDVVVFADAARVGLFHDVHEQSDIYHAMFEALGWSRGGVLLER